MYLRSMLVVAACAACAALPVAAATYKWIDENGRVVYGDTPPPGVKAERLDLAVPAANPNAARELAAKDAELKKRAQDRADADANTAKQVAEDRALLDRCVQARGRMATLRADVRLYRYNEKGEQVTMDAAERERTIAETDKYLRDLNCPPVAGTPVGTPTGTATTGTPTTGIPTGTTTTGTSTTY
jgi:hypothetical protein